jgi:tRNA-dihydrouridine synthase B
MYPAELKIRDLRITPAAVLAPMAGVTDTLFRRVIRGLGGCGLLMTEFTSSEGITRSAAKTLRYLYFQEDEHPITAQLFGANPKVMADAARMVEDLGYDAVDINLGCPAKKVVKCGGSGLLRDLPLLGEIFRTVRAAVRIPLTIKLRAGWDENSIVAVDVAKLAEDIGVEGVAVHPRTRQQGYTGAADWKIIAAVKQAVKMPVIGNGDVNSPEDAERMFRETGCDAVMIGRAAATNPWIFRQMQQYAATGAYDTPSEADRRRLLSGYYKQINAANLPDAIGKMKQFACWFTHGVGNGSELRRIVHAARTPGEVVEKVEAFFANRTAAAVASDPNGSDGGAASAAGAKPFGRSRAARNEDPAHGPVDAEHHEATLGA